MSKELVKTEGFASQGHDSYPDIYLDRQKLVEVSEMEMRSLGALAQRYYDFLKRDDLLPDHKTRATENFRRILFERGYRTGFYDKCPDDVSELA